MPWAGSLLFDLVRAGCTVGDAVHFLVTFSGYILMILILDNDVWDWDVTCVTPAPEQRFLRCIYTFHKDFKTLIKLYFF